MPPELLTLVHQHHNALYQGEHANYVRLTLLADRLIQRLEIGDVRQLELPAAAMTELGMDEEMLLTVFHRLLDARADLDQLAEGLILGCLSRDCRLPRRLIIPARGGD